MKIKRFLFLIVAMVVMATGSISAQRNLVGGRVLDSRTEKGIQFATAVLLKKDSTVAASAQTDSLGNFAIKAPAPGSYIVRFTQIGYDTKYADVAVLRSSDSVSVGNVKLQNDGVVLGEAVVSVAAARVEQKADTTMFNAAAYRTPEGSTLESLVKQLPGVEVSDDGTIKWNGKEVKQLLVNGKDFFKGDKSVAMKNLPTDLVSKIKAYDKASDYSKLTGVDDGEETTVLDISTKRQLNESWIANVDLGYGTKDRYSNQIFASRFSDKSSVSAYGQINNTNNMGFGGPMGFGGRSGLTSTKQGGIDFSWHNDKEEREKNYFEVGGNFRYSHSGTDRVSTSSSEMFLTSGATSSFSNSSSLSRSKSTNLGGEFRLEWSPDSMTSIIFRPEFSYRESNSNGNSLSATFNDDPYSIDGMFSPLDSIFSGNNAALQAIAVNRNKRLSLSDSKSASVSGSLNLVRRLNSNGRNVSARINGGYSNSKSHSYSISTIDYFNSDNRNSFLNQYSNMPSKSWNYSARAGYVEPLGKNWFAEARYQFSYKYTDGDRSRYNLDSLLYKSEWSELFGQYGNSENYPAIGSLPNIDEALNAVRDLQNSQYATYKYYDHTASLSLRYNSKALRFSAGVDFNPEKTNLNYNRPGQNIDTLITRKVFNVSPSMRLRYKITETKQFEMNYRGSSSQPSMTDLIAVVDDSDPLNISMGNPGLKPSWSNSLRAFLRGYDPEKQQGFMGGFDFSQTKNSVSNKTVYDDATGVRYSRPENIDGNWNGALHGMFNTALDKKKLFTITSFTFLRYENSVGYISRLNSASPTQAMQRVLADAKISPTLLATTATADRSYDYYNSIFNSAEASKNTTKSLSVNENLNLSYRASWFDVGLLGTLNYLHARASLQDNANMDTWNFGYGANANFNFDFGLSISTDIRMNSRRGYSDASMNTNELVWNAQIAQSFLKSRNATISIQFYDILRQQSNVSRSISATMRSDSWNNAINSFAMVHFIYRLNIFPGGKKGSSSEGDRGPGGDRRGRGPMGPPRGMRPMRIM